MGSKGDVKHSVCVFFAWHGLESCWCFGPFESDADETLSSHRSESTFRTGTRTRLLRALILLRKGLPCGFAWLGYDFFVFSGFQKQRFGIFQAAISQWFFIGSKGHVRHSFGGVFFAWHGLESCWCFGLFGSEADVNLSSHRAESTLLAPFLVQKLAFFGP